MVYVYKGVNGRKLSEVIALQGEVQNALEAVAFEVAVRAEALLIEHRLEGHSEIDIAHGDIDYYVALDDSRGLDAALSIEFGRSGYIDPETGLVVGQMAPLYILTDAANLPKKRKLLPSLKPYKRNKVRQQHRNKKRKKK